MTVGVIKFLQRHIIGSALIAFGLAISMSAPGEAATIWHVTPTVNVGTDFNELRGVTATAVTDVWAVGTFRNTSLQYQTLAQHFDGTAWHLATTPNVGNSYNFLNGVDAVTSSDVWSVGQSSVNSHYLTLAEHWNGTAWSVVATPNVIPQDNVLVSVSALSSTDIWAVGYTNDLGNFKTLTEHWNGSTWSVVPSRNVGNESRLTGVAAISATDVWAAGEANEKAFVEHWNGSAWSIVKTPRTLGESLFAGVAASSSADVWAVGSNGSSTLTEHWDGTAWAIVPSPNPLPSSRGNNGLFAVATLSSGDVWAVGASLDFVRGSLSQTITMKWDGTSWTTQPSPNAGSGDNKLLGIAAVAPSSLAAVGFNRPTIASYERTLGLLTASG